jgi:bone morphogenetic protein receptor type-1B
MEIRIDELCCFDHFRRHCLDESFPFRYLAPEVLTNSQRQGDFDAYKEADVYSMGLVLWEVVSRLGPDAPQHSPPYWDIVGDDPAVEDMAKVVCSGGQRPEVPAHVAVLPAGAVAARVMTECWYERPEARLTALRARKTLALALEGRPNVTAIATTA